MRYFLTLQGYKGAEHRVTADMELDAALEAYSMFCSRGLVPEKRGIHMEDGSPVEKSELGT